MQVGGLCLAAPTRSPPSAPTTLPGGGGRRLDVSHRPSAVNGWGSRRSPGGRPEPMWPPAFALRGPDENFRLAPRLRRGRLDLSSRWWASSRPVGCASCGPDAWRRLIPERLKPTTGGGFQAPPGSGVLRPPDSPASLPVRASASPGSTPDKGPRSDPRCGLAATRRPLGPARSRPAARPGPGPRTPSPRDGTGEVYARSGGRLVKGLSKVRGIEIVGRFRPCVDGYGALPSGREAPVLAAGADDHAGHAALGEGFAGGLCGGLGHAGEA